MFFISLYISLFSGLQETDINHDSRISALEENGGGGGESQNSNIFRILLNKDTVQIKNCITFRIVFIAV